MSKKGIEDLKKEYEGIRMSETQVDAFKQSIERAKKDNRRIKRMRGWKIAGTAVAAVFIAFIILPNTSATVAHAMAKIPFLGNVVQVVTFRDYKYESETQIAEIDVPKLEIAEENETDGGVVTADVMSGEDGLAYNGDAENASSVYVLEESADKINSDIEELTNRIIADFEEAVKGENGVKEVIVSHEVVATPGQYFTLKLTHYESEADGMEYVYYYTIDMTTGEYLKLQDLFVEDADYIGAISEEIIRQMREQMATNETVAYWLDEEMDDWNFKEITEDTQFYINANNHLVISFNEGDVAPMYMGVVTFEIPAEVLEGIRK